MKLTQLEIDYDRRYMKLSHEIITILMSAQIAVFLFGKEEEVIQDFADTIFSLIFIIGLIGILIGI